MRKLLFTVAATFFYAIVFAQPPNWYVAISTGVGWGGPKGSIENKFQEAHFNQTNTFNFFGFGGSTKYPIISSGVPLLFKAGKKLKGNKSVLLMGGISAAAEVSGYKRPGAFSNNNFDFFGTYVRIRYHIIQLTVGIEHTMPGSRVKLGYAPGVFLLHSSDASAGMALRKTTSVVPGLTLTGQWPLGKEKKFVGLALVADLNLAPPISIQAQYKSFVDSNGSSSEVEVLTPTKVRMLHGMAGLALILRKKQNVSKPF